MRVLHVVKGLGPGGAERLLVSLAQVRAGDVDMHVAYVLPHKRHLVPELQAAGVEVTLLGGRRGLADVRWIARLVSHVRATRPDVVHVHSPAVAPPVRLAVRAAHPRPAVVSTEHNLWPSFAWPSRVANGLTFGLNDAAFAVSAEVRSSVWQRHRDSVDVLVHGIPITSLIRRRSERRSARAALGVDDDAVLVATVANFREKKDYPTLLAAAAACRDEPLRFVSIGQGPLAADLERRHAELDLDRTFRFLGFIPDPASVVAGADLFVLTSRHEGLPIALLEAMALEVAPVVSAVGGIPEVVTDQVDGVLVGAGDVDGFVDALRRLAGDPRRRLEIAAAAARRAESFDIARTAEILEDRYRRLVAGRA